MAEAFPIDRGSALCPAHTLPLVSTMTFQGRQHYPHFLVEKTESGLLRNLPKASRDLT